MLNHYNVEDFSCDFAIPIAYLDLIRERLERTDEHNEVHLNKTEATAFLGMLCDAAVFFCKVDQALYSKDAKSELAISAATPAV